MLMRSPCAQGFFILIFIVLANTVYGQQYRISGTVHDSAEHSTLPGASVIISRKGSVPAFKTGTATDTGGSFSVGSLPAGKYSVVIHMLGFRTYSKTVMLANNSVDIGAVYLATGGYQLNDVKVSAKIAAAVQHDDTTEFNAAAFKTNPDADAADLLRKMPGMEVSGSSVKAQGEQVTKVLIDGKPFFGSDPYAAVKNMPADAISKVQVYDEESEQNQFTGFSSGQTTKTVNIITREDKRNGAFGKISAGIGDDDHYAVGGNVNEFSGDRRVSLTAQSNNVNIQNFSAQPNAGGGGTGLTTTDAAGLNYSDKWGKKIIVSGSYFFNHTDNETERDIRRQYVLSGDSGQVYNEAVASRNHNNNHNFSARIEYHIDSMNSLLFLPQLGLNNSNGSSTTHASTQDGDTLLNETFNDHTPRALGYHAGGDLLFRHRFHKRGRTLSFDLDGGNSYGSGTTYLDARNLYYDHSTPSDTLAQLTDAHHNTVSLSGTAIYTEPLSKNSQLRVQYNISDQPAYSDRLVTDYSAQTQLYTIPDTALSNTFRSKNIAQQAGLAYALRSRKIQLSAGVNYQYSTLHSDQELPYAFTLDHAFSTLLPLVHLHYHISKTKTLRVSYSTSTSIPSVTQLQDVVNNSNPLQLSRGNPDLRQPYSHNAILRYNSAGATSGINFAATVSGTYTQNYITSNTIIATNTDTIGSIILPKGGQLTMPVNLNSYRALNAYMNYGLPLPFIHCNLSVNLNGSWQHQPGIINSVTNYSENKVVSLGAGLSSNISEHLDFTLSASATVNNTHNSINPGVANTYVNGNGRAMVNWIFWKGIVFNSEITYQANSGLAAGYNNTYALWNLSIGKKFLKKQQADIRLVVNDVLNQAQSISHSVTEVYISDVRTSVLQRYFLLTFTYKLRAYKAAPKK